MRSIPRLGSLVLLLALAACGKEEESGPPPIPAQTDPALSALVKFIEEKKIDRTAAMWKTRLPKPPKVEFDPAKTYVWELETNKGTMTFELLPRVAPMHVSSFAYLTLLGFFDGLKFHRVIRGFMAQGGDPMGNGSGGPGYGMDVEISPTVRHDKPGVLSTAHSALPSSDGSQFFITFKPTPALDGGYTVFGTIRTGEDVLKELEAVGHPTDGPPLEPLSIVKATIKAQ
jgi:peptidyl-prolyl cis-trans isomerase B (cyclophilin B)